MKQHFMLAAWDLFRRVVVLPFSMDFDVHLQNFLEVLGLGPPRALPELLQTLPDLSQAPLVPLLCSLEAPSLQILENWLPREVPMVIM